MSQNDLTNNSNIIQLIGNLSSQSTESSNIVLRAISQGISSGLSQGIASGNISFSLQDFITLATVFKPKDDVALRLVDGLLPKTYNTSQENASRPIHKNEHTTIKAFANPDSLSTSNDSSGLPSSDHVFDVTTEKSRAHEHTVSQWVSRNADDDNAENSCISTMSGGETNDSTSSTSIKTFSRKRLFHYISDADSSSNEAIINSRMRIESSHYSLNKAIESVSEISDYVVECPNSVPETVIMAHKKLSKTNGK